MAWTETPWLPAFSGFCGAGVAACGGWLIRAPFTFGAGGWGAPGGWASCSLSAGREVFLGGGGGGGGGGGVVWGGGGWGEAGPKAVVRMAASVRSGAVTSATTWPARI